MTGPQLEIEAKLRVPGAAALAKLPELLAELELEIEPRGSKTVRDDYLDTPDWDFFKAGYALRLRKAPAKAVFTLKALKPVEGGMASREEHEEEVPLTEGEVLQIPTEVLDGRVRAISGGKRLNILFRVEQDRAKFIVRSPAGLEAEASADQVRYRAGDRAREECEVELELLAGSAEELRALATQLAEQPGWEPATASKFERALALSGLSPA